MAVFRELTLVWRGKEYFVTPTMRLMRSIEMGDISLADISLRTAQGKYPISHIAFVLYKLLNSAGAPVSEEDVYEELMNGDSDQIGKLIQLTLMAFTPGERESKNQDAPA